MSRLFSSGVTLDDLDLSSLDPDSGVDMAVTSLTGWTGSPASNLAITQKRAAHGGWGRRNPYLAPRVMTCDGYVSGDPAAVSEMIDRIVDAASLSAVRMDVTEGRRTRWAMVQRNADEVIVDDTLGYHVTYSIPLIAADPLKYGETSTVTTGLPASAGGVAVPFGVPFGITSTVASGQATATNPGNANGPVIIRIYGPVTAPVITHVGTGKTLAFSTSLDVADGDYLLVDMRNQKVLLNCTASRAGWVTQRGWSQFEPGGNTWAFTAPNPSPTTRIEVDVTAAWK